MLSFRSVRLLAPPSEPDVRVTTHPALHDLKSAMDWSEFRACAGLLGAVANRPMERRFVRQSTTFIGHALNGTEARLADRLGPTPPWHRMTASLPVPVRMRPATRV